MVYGNNSFNNGDKLVFEAIVSPDISYDNLNLAWTMEFKEEDGSSTVDNLLDYHCTTQYHNYLVIDTSEDNTSLWQANIDYNIIVTVEIDVTSYECSDDSSYNSILCDQVATANTTIVMNDAPLNGSCKITTDSENGDVYALETLVTVTCDKWFDKDDPLTYRFVLNDGML